MITSKIPPQLDNRWLHLKTTAFHPVDLFSLAPESLVGRTLVQREIRPNFSSAMELAHLLPPLSNTSVLEAQC